MSISHQTSHFGFLEAIKLLLPLLTISVVMFEKPAEAYPATMPHLDFYPYRPIERYLTYGFNTCMTYLYYYNEETVPSCVKIWGYIAQSNLAGTPAYNSGTFCGNFTTIFPCKGIKHFKVHPIQINHFKVQYAMGIFEKSSTNQSYYTVGGSGPFIIMRQFPHLAARQIQPNYHYACCCIKDAEVMVELKTNVTSNNPNPNSSIALFFSQDSVVYCLNYNVRMRVNANCNKKWYILTNFSVSSPVYDYEVFQNDFVGYFNQTPANQPILLWDRKKQMCVVPGNQSIDNPVEENEVRVDNQNINGGVGSGSQQFAKWKIAVISVSGFVGLVAIFGIGYCCYTRSRQSQNPSPAPQTQNPQQLPMPPLKNTTGNQGSLCSLCLEGNANHELPCSHHFHKGCIGIEGEAGGEAVMAGSGGCPACSREGGGATPNVMLSGENV